MKAMRGANLHTVKSACGETGTVWRRSTLSNDQPQIHPQAIYRVSSCCIHINYAITSHPTRVAV